MSVDNTDKDPDLPSQNLSDMTFQRLGERLGELEEWGWVSSDPGVDTETRQMVFDRVFPDGNTAGPWSDYHWVRSEFDRRAAEEFDLGQ